MIKVAGSDLSFITADGQVNVLILNYTADLAGSEGKLSPAIGLTVSKRNQV